MSDSKNGTRAGDQSRAEATSDSDELAKGWAAVAEKSQRLVAEFLSRQKGEGGIGMADPMSIGAAFIEMTARMIPVVRASLARVTAEQCGLMAAEALDADGPEEARHRAVRILDP